MSNHYNLPLRRRNGGVTGAGKRGRPEPHGRPGGGAGRPQTYGLRTPWGPQPPPPPKPPTNPPKKPKNPPPHPRSPKNPKGTDHTGHNGGRAKVALRATIKGENPGGGEKQPGNRDAPGTRPDGSKSFGATDLTAQHQRIMAHWDTPPPSNLPATTWGAPRSPAEGEEEGGAGSPESPRTQEAGRRWPGSPLPPGPPKRLPRQEQGRTQRKGRTGQSPAG